MRMSDLNDWLPKYNCGVKCEQLLGRHFALIPCGEEQFCFVRRKADGLFGVEEWHGKSGASVEDFIVLYVTDDKASALTPFLMELAKNHGLPSILGMPPQSLAVTGANTVSSWSGHPEELAKLYAEIRGYSEFVIGGSYDTSFNARTKKNI